MENNKYNKYNCGNCSAIVIERNGRCTNPESIGACPICECDTLVVIDKNFNLEKHNIVIKDKESNHCNHVWGVMKNESFYNFQYQACSICGLIRKI